PALPPAEKGFANESASDVPVSRVRPARGSECAATHAGIAACIRSMRSDVCGRHTSADARTGAKNACEKLHRSRMFATDDEASRSPQTLETRQPASRAQDQATTQCAPRTRAICASATHAPFAPVRGKLCFFPATGAHIMERAFTDRAEAGRTLASQLG